MTPEEFERAFGGEERVAWMRWQPSVVSGRTPCVSAHVRGGGEARRADACWTVPLLYEEHEQMHIGQETFAREHGLDLDALAQQTEARWQTYLRTTTRPTW